MFPIMPLIEALIRAGKVVRRDGPNALLFMGVSFSTLIPGVVIVLMYCFWASGQSPQQWWMVVLILPLLFIGLLAGYGTWKLWEQVPRINALFRDQLSNDQTN